MLQLHAGAVVDMLKSDRHGVIVITIEALHIMPQVELATHIELDPEMLKQYAGTVVNMIQDSDAIVRRIARRAAESVNLA